MALKGLIAYFPLSPNPLQHLMLPKSKMRAHLAFWHSEARCGVYFSEINAGSSPCWKGPKMGQDGPKMASGCPKMAQDGPKKLQDGPEMDQDGPKMSGPYDVLVVALLDPRHPGPYITL